MSDTVKLHGVLGIVMAYIAVCLIGGVLMGPAAFAVDTARDSGSASGQQDEPAASIAELELGDLTEVEYTYEDRLGTPDVRLHATVSSITAQGANLTIEKCAERGGEVCEATYRMSAEDVAELWGILVDYDAVALSQGRALSSYGGRSRNILRFEAAGQGYYLFELTAFPDTVPPVRDQMYARVFNLFNAYVSADPKMEAVWTDDLTDPADMPRNQERTVVFRGREVSLVPGTGNDDGYNAQIADSLGAWWVNEGYVGHWRTTDEDLANDDGLGRHAELWVETDGTWRLVVDGIECSGTAPKGRMYRPDATLSMESPLRRGMHVYYVEYDDEGVWTFSVADDRTTDHICITVEPLPYPEEEFEVWAYLTRVG